MIDLARFALLKRSLANYVNQPSSGQADARRAPDWGHPRASFAVRRERAVGALGWRLLLLLLPGEMALLVLLGFI